MLLFSLSCACVSVEGGRRQYGVLFNASGLCLFKSEWETGVYTNFCLCGNSTECKLRGSGVSDEEHHFNPVLWGPSAAVSFLGGFCVKVKF